MTNVVKFYDRKIYDQNIEDGEIENELSDASHMALRLMSAINNLEMNRLQKFSIRECEKVISEIADNLDQLHCFYMAWLKDR